MASKAPAKTAPAKAAPVVAKKAAEPAPAKKVEAAAPAKKAEIAKPAPAKAATTPAVAATPVPETILKKRKSSEEILALRTKTKADKQKKLKIKRKTIFKRAEQYVNEYRAQEKSLIRFKRQAKAAGNYYVEPDHKLAVVIRIRGINGLHPKPRKILQLLRLRQINNAIFLRINHATLTMLKSVEPYITFGYPNLKSVKELIYKRGFAKVNKQRLPITDNSIIENSLGKHGIVCAEDLVHEVITVGPHFRDTNKFLWPFKLSTPKGGWNYVKTHFNEGGDAGNREDKINELLHKMT
jgi:large subunit ribosomal protein L7e